MKPVLIAGGGAAGLTAALELVQRSDKKPVVVEALSAVGGLARTEEHNGNRMDIGGHRFFSKSDWVMNWWGRILPLPPDDAPVGFVPPEERTLLLRSRLSRIYYLKRFFDYPVSASLNTVRNLGLARTCRMAGSYLMTKLRPPRKENSLEDFFINRFGSVLYRTFFREYTEKVWGVPCHAISPSWGAQRIKGVSLPAVVLNGVRQMFARRDADVSQKHTEPSLITRFLYPKFGPGQMWEVVAEKVTHGGGEVKRQTAVRRIFLEDNRVAQVELENLQTHETECVVCEALISSLPLKDLIFGMSPPPPQKVCEVAENLQYRDFMTVGLLVRQMKKQVCGTGSCPPDNWIYIQEPDVRIGRLQIFNNWSPALVKNTDNTVWLGLEYFCQEGDDLWSMSDADMEDFAAAELEKIGMIDTADVLDAHVIRVQKAYPAYFGSYDEISVVQDWLDGIENLYPVGRNGMHRYNNQDHSMLTARMAVDHLLGKLPDKREIWQVNAGSEYLECGKDKAVGTEV